MANSSPSMTMNGSWQNVYTTSSIAVGAKLIIQNKSSKPCLIWIAATAPAANFDDGYVITPLEEMILTAGEAGCFAKGYGSLCVQAG